MIAKHKVTGKIIFDGPKADLRRANLRGADLSWADLGGADLDFSCLPLWCGSFGVIVDKNQFDQITYHLCRLNCPEREKEQNKLKGIANQWNGIDRYDLPKIEGK